MALPTKITLEIVTPDRALVTEQVDEVELPGSEGYFGVLPGHSPLLASLQVGELWYRIGNEKYYLSIAFGFVEVLIFVAILIVGFIWIWKKGALEWE